MVLPETQARLAELEAEELALEENLLELDLARDYFKDFVKYMLSAEMLEDWGPHHDVICDYLQQLWLGISDPSHVAAIQFGLLNTPPGWWKTLLCSKLFPAWLLGKMPNIQIVIGSYSATVAKDLSSDVKAFIGTTQYQEVFGAYSMTETTIEVDKNKRSSALWQLEGHRGKVRAVGIKGSLTSFRAHYMVVDDPYEGRMAAERESTRKEVMDWWHSTASKRLEKRKRAVLITHTRWHQDDITATFLKQMAAGKGRKWTPLVIHAVCRDDLPLTIEEQAELWKKGVHRPIVDPLGRLAGQPGWPAGESLDELRVIEEEDDYEYAALYQQEPFTRKGGMFKEEWFVIVDAMPPEDEVVDRIWFWDNAASKKKTSKYTAGVRMSITKRNNFYVERVHHDRLTTHERREAQKKEMQLTAFELGHRDTEMWFEQEPSAAGIDSAQDTVRALVGWPVFYEKPSGSKETRWKPWEAACQAGLVRLVRGDWNDAYIDEHKKVSSTAKYKDQVDASADAYAKLAKHMDDDGEWVL